MTTLRTVSFLLFLMILSSYTSTFLKSGKHYKHTSFLSLKEIVELSATQAFCFLNSNGTVYDFNPLYNTASDYSISENNYLVSFNICKNALNTCGNKTSLVKYIPVTDDGIPQTNQCTSLAGAAEVVSKWTVYQDTIANTTKIKVDLSDGDTCQSDKSSKYKTSMIMICDQQAESPIMVKPYTMDINKCSNTIQIRTKWACPQLNVYSFWNQIISNKWIVGPAMVLLGIFLAFFGLKFYYVTEIITGCLVTTFIMIFLLFSNLKFTYNSMEFWLIIAVSILAGIIVGYFVAKCEKVPTMILAGCLGYVLGATMYHFLLSSITWNPQIVYWSTIAACILLLVIIAFFFHKHILILSTSIIGAYCIVKGIGYMAGGYPDENQIIDLTMKGEFYQLKQMFDWRFYSYAAALIVIAIMGIVIQYKFFYTSDDEEEGKKENAKKDLTLDNNDASTEKLMKK